MVQCLLETGRFRGDFVTAAAAERLAQFRRVDAVQPHLQLPLVVGQGRERVTVMDANDAGGDRLHVGGVGPDADGSGDDGDEEEHALEHLSGYLVVGTECGYSSVFSSDSTNAETNISASSPS